MLISLELLITEDLNSINSNCTIIILHQSDLVYVHDTSQATFKWGGGAGRKLAIHINHQRCLFGSLISKLYSRNTILLLFPSSQRY